MAADIGIRLYKVAMPWPLEPDGIREFAQGLDEIWWSKKTPNGRVPTQRTTVQLA